MRLSKSVQKIVFWGSLAGLIFLLAACSRGDGVPPQISIDQPVSGSSVPASEVRVRGEASDSSGVNRLTYQLNGGVEYPLTISAGQRVSFDFTATGLAEGPNSVWVNAYDTTGMKSTARVEVKRNPTESAPQVTLSEPANNSSIGSSSIAVKGTASDDKGVIRLTYRLNGAGEQQVSINQGQSVPFFFSVSGLQSGSNTILVTAYDAAGLKASASVSVSYTPASPTAPKISIGQPADGSSVGTTTVRILGSASDDKGVSRLSFQLNDEPEESVSVTPSTSVSIDRTLGFLEPGANVVVVSAYDADNLKGSASFTVNYTPPPTPPSLNITEPASNSTLSSNTVTVKGSASDDTRVIHVGYRLNGGTEQNVSITASKSVSLNFSVSGLEPGSNTLVVSAYDNNETRSSVSLNLTYTPNTPPTVSIASPSNGSSVTSSTLTVTGSASDDKGVSRLTYQLNGGAEQNLSITAGASVSFSFNLSGLREGSNTLLVNAYDAANARGSASVSVTYSSQPPPTGSLSFKRVEIDANSPQSAWMKGIGDLNADGLPDLIIGGDNVELVWYEAPNWIKHTIDTSTRSQSGSAVADLDQDGDLDVLIGTNWYENNGSGSAWVKHPLGNAGTHDIVVADMNKDGRLDVAMRGESDSPVTFFLQQSGGQWNTFDIDPGYGRNGLDVGDIDRDGWPDVAVGGIWMKNPGGDIASGSWAKYTFASGWPQYAAVKLVDLNADGRLDAVLSPSEQSGEVAWLEAPANPTGPWTRHTIQSDVDSIHSLDVVDMDGDGRLDVVGSEFRGNKRLFVWLNRGGSWEARVLATEGLHQTRVADIGSDGDYDIFGHVCPEPEACFGTGPVVLMENQAASGASRVLVFSKTETFRHDSIPDGIAAIRQLSSQNGFAVDATEDPTAFTSGNLARYRAVIFLNTQGNVLNPSQQSAFQQYIRAGGGFVGIHSAADTLSGWPWYVGLVGARFAGEIRASGLKLTVTDGAHPSTQGLPSPWYFELEAYNFDVNPKSNGTSVLLNLDESYVTGGTMGSDHPMAWYHPYDGGRSWYTNLGSDRADYSDPRFLGHLLGGIRWAGNFGLP
jgi:type 1 glutamine amidotransferase